MNDKNDILQMLRNREDEFHLPLRKDGWKKLEAELPPLMAVEEMTGGRTKPARRKLYAWVAVAAIALLCLMIPVVVSHDEEPEEVAAVESPVVPSPEKKKEVTPVLPQEMIPAKNVQVRFFPYIQMPDSLMPELYRVELPEMVVIAGNAADSVGETEQATPKHGDSGPQPDRRNYLPYRPVEEKKKIFDFNRFAFGIHTGSNQVTNMGGGFEHHEEWVSQPDHPGPEEKPENPDKKPTEELQTKAATGGGGGSSENWNTDYYYRHHIPITFGVSARMSITRRIALETGLSYTYLYSEILEERKTYDGSQKLHYVGVPLKLSWTFYNWKNLSLYASGGGMIEYCVSAKKTGEDLRINRWQPSWNAAVGMQAELRKPLSLFVEPGVSYYYNMNPQYRNSLIRFESMRTVHPFTFTLQVGIRFTY